MNDPFASAPQRQDNVQSIDSGRAASDTAVADAALADTALADTAADTAGTDDLARSVDESIDLDAIERDLTDVQTALERLNDGSYWTDEVSGEALPDEVLASFPLTRTVAGRSAT